MSTAKKRWWRVALAAAVAAGGIGLAARFAGAQTAPQTKKTEATWTRSTSAPIVPAAAPVPLPQIEPPAPGPRSPSLPPLPGDTLPGAPPAPVPPDIKPVAPPKSLDLPKSTQSQPGPNLPPLPSSTGSAQSAPPAKSAEPLKPPSLLGPDFNLRQPKPANTVKSDGPSAGPNVPPPAGETREPLGSPIKRPKPVQGPLVESELDTFPLPKPTAPMPHPGEPTMTNVFKPVALAAVIGGALALAPTKPVAAFPQEGAKKDPPTPAELKKMIDDTNVELAKTQTNLKQLTELLVDGTKDEKGVPIPGLSAQVKRLTELVDGRKEPGGFRLESDPGLVAEVKKVRDSLDELKKRVDRMSSTEVQRPANVTPDPLAGKGTVRLVNDYPVRVSILVNDRSYHVEPRSKEDVTVPAGDFTYQLLSTGTAAVKSTIKEKEVVTLRIK